ncbi:DUF1836 domain-containing protein [Clostridium sp. AM58-1XD]|uniref:DUF1836 domain-containing protein n=1 Tax=Clostridium sp. AM58-1XD TaxID=2292307 RepID=UPI000E528147|nr:DUF1836 domain-containing protein [Clostridium sp. AM58-1XD]RGY96363.1 DUF1836 domain-containing protein [Clostridium sp. AM58-1XD]
MKTNDERLHDIVDRLGRLSYVTPEDIPNIDLYMDQVTTFMDTHLGVCKRDDEDKILTKTMINNYAKNNLLPPPNKKKYSREHILLLIFIYYYKNILSITDIGELLRPITEGHFASGSSPSLSRIYEEVFSLEQEQRQHLKDDVLQKFEHALKTFPDVDDSSSEKEYLQLFAFLSELAFDVYLKKQMIEKIIDELKAENTRNSSMKKKK